MFTGLRAGLAHAFSTAPPPLAPEDERLLDEIARRVAERRLSVPALLALDAVKHTPGLHVLFFGAAPLAEPFARLLSFGVVRNAGEAERLVRLSERREHIEALMRKIEAAAA